MTILQEVHDSARKFFLVNNSCGVTSIRDRPPVRFSNGLGEKQGVER